MERRAREEEGSVGGGKRGEETRGGDAYIRILIFEPLGAFS